MSPSVPEKVDVYSYATIGNRDRLISFNDECFNYNELGNPICYRNHTLSWERMSLLASYDGNTFEYNASGIRCKKNNTVYTLSGKRILKETNGSNTIVYYYGVNGVVGFNYNGTDYYYGRNLLGDITEIYTATGIKVASYVYDAWGGCTIVSDTSNCNISAINPFRYRGYYFDTETNLYYLDTRYYDPQIGRFISQDSTKYLDPETIGGFNLYCYCGDNPIMYIDPTGTFWDYIFDAIFIVWGVVDIVCGGYADWKSWVALGVDVALAVIPFVPSGTGQVIKAGNKIDNALDIANTINKIDNIQDVRKVTVIGRNMDRVHDVASAIGKVDELYKPWQKYDTTATGLRKIRHNMVSVAHDGFWTYRKLRQGYTIIDIGMPSKVAVKGLWYGIERIVVDMWETRNFWKLIINFFA